jgi:type IV pilus assembly protein PilC
MITYKYKAKNKTTGKMVEANVDAQSIQDASSIIKGLELIPISIETLNKESVLNIRNFSKRIKAKEKVMFARQLSTLMNAGLPLAQSLRNIEDQTKNKNFKVIIVDIIASIEAGQSLSQSMEKFPKVFNKVTVNLVAAGEASGTMDASLERIANQLEKESDITSKIRGAMIYPIVVILVMIAVLVFMLVKVVPQIKILYTSFPGTSLPIETRVLLDISNNIIRYWWIIILVGGLLIVFLARWIRTKSGTRFIDSLKLNMPPFKNLFRMIYMARFSRTAATLMGAGVPLLSVLDVVSESVDNYQISQSIKKAAEKVKGGKSLGDILSNDPNFLPLVPSMIKIGEKSGSIEAMLNKSADYYEKEVDIIISSISTIIEPVMIVLLGIVAMIIVAAILLPIYSLAGSGAISSGGI